MTPDNNVLLNTASKDEGSFSVVWDHDVVFPREHFFKPKINIKIRLAGPQRRKIHVLKMSISQSTENETIYLAFVSIL